MTSQRRRALVPWRTRGGGGSGVRGRGREAPRGEADPSRRGGAGGTYTGEGVKASCPTAPWPVTPRRRSASRKVEPARAGSQGEIRAGRRGSGRAAHGRPRARIMVRRRRRATSGRPPLPRAPIEQAGQRARPLLGHGGPREVLRPGRARGPRDDHELEAARQGGPELEPERLAAEAFHPRTDDGAADLARHHEAEPGWRVRGVLTCRQQKHEMGRRHPVARPLNSLEVSPRPDALRAPVAEPHFFQTETVRRWRPLRRRFERTARPPTVAMRARKPWVRRRRMLEGW